MMASKQPVKRENYSPETAAAEDAFLRMKHAEIDGDRFAQLKWARRYARAVQSRRQAGVAQR